MSSTKSHQFICSICGDGFEQKSRLERHMATAHPQQAPSAADIEKALAGIHYPKTMEELVEYASQKTSNEELLKLIKSFPNRLTEIDSLNFFCDHKGLSKCKLDKPFGAIEEI
jgi:hypothetical protein